MHTKNMKFERKLRLVCVVASWILLLLVVVSTRSSSAQELHPKTFSSPAGATEALFQAAQNEDEQALEAILGAGKEVTSSNDEVEDKLEREQFTQKYREMHRLVQELDGSTVLYIGAENWPFPVPLVSKDGAWYFDSHAGMQEITFRRIGENEAAAMEVCGAFAAAKKQGETKPAGDDDPIGQYAQRLIAGSAENGSSSYHGYYFRIVTADSAAATAHVSGDKKKGGLALVAYPAEYRSSGVKTFVVSQGGSVYEKDLGADTTKVAPSIKARSSSWRLAE